MEYDTQVIQDSCKDTELILRRYTFILHSGITACSLDSRAIYRRLSGHQHKVGGAGQCSFEELGRYCQGKDLDDLTPFFAHSSFTCISWERARVHCPPRAFSSCSVGGPHRRCNVHTGVGAAQVSVSVAQMCRLDILKEIVQNFRLCFHLTACPSSITFSCSNPCIPTVYEACGRAIIQHASSTKDRPVQLGSP